MGSKRILDACCGSKMFWFDKNNPDVEFCDIREMPKTEYYPGKYIEINPDTICNFTDLPFEDNIFYLVIDPCFGSGSTARAAVELGRNFYGFEINKEFYRRAKEEMLKFPEEQQLSIFDI